MPELIKTVSANLRRIRTARGVTIADLSRRSTVAYATIVNLQGGSGNPTIETLDALASALGVPLAELVEDGAARARVIRAEDAEWIRGKIGRTRVAGRLEGFAVVDVFDNVLEPGSRLPIPGVPTHPAGTSLFVYVVSGRIVTGPESEQTELGAGDSILYPIDLPWLLETIEGPAHLLFLTGSIRSDDISMRLAAFGAAHESKV